jgi:hypothetical protein
MSTDWYSLFSGSFEESVRYLGEGKWAYVIEDHMDGTAEGDRFSTKRLIEFVLERDDGDRALKELVEEKEEEEEEEEEEERGSPLGPRGSRLLEIAREVGAKSCVRRLQGMVDGTWPPRKPAPRILAVTGVTERLVWRSRHAVFAVETRVGPGYLYPPSEDGTATLILKSSASSSSDPKWTIRLGRKLRAQIAAHAAALDGLRKSPRG